jgi:hypothetical protein
MLAQACSRRLEAKRPRARGACDNAGRSDDEAAGGAANAHLCTKMAQRPHLFPPGTRRECANENILNHRVSH